MNVPGALRPFLIAACAVTGGVLVRLALQPVLASTQVWLTFWPAMFFAAWYGGPRAGITVAVLSLAIVGIWAGPRTVLDWEQGAIGATVFVACGIAFSIASGSARRAGDQERATNRRMRSLVDLASVLAACDSLDAVARAVVTEGVRAARADTAVLYVLDEATRLFRIVASHGAAPDLLERLREVDVASEHGQKLAVEQWAEGAGDGARLFPEVAAVQSPHKRPLAYWSMPLTAGSDTIGVLAMGYFDAQVFPDEEREFVRLFAHHCAQAVARAERSARLERERLRLERIFDSNLIGTVFWDETGRIVRANDSFLRSIGYTRADLASGVLTWQAITPPEHEQAQREAFAQLLATGSNEPYARDCIHKDGHHVPVLIASSAFFDDRRQGVTFVADLSDVRRAAAAADSAKDEFLAMLGHELRNPLAPITTALELIEMRGPTPDDRELGIIRRQVRHIAKLVDDLLDVSRIRAGKVRLSRKPVEVRELVTAAVETAAPLLEERRHDLAIVVPPSGLVVDVDRTRMVQVLGNVIANAAKYTDERGAIRIEARRAGADVEIDITDTGVGIEPALLSRVFELFTQEAQTSARSRGGLGLGLAIARTFTELHGGTITAHSDGTGRGSRFSIRLALAAERAVDAEAPARSDTTNARARRVLVVDDNNDAADLLADLVGLRGHDTRKAADGPAALRLLEDFVPDVALLDLGLPAMDGYELAQRVRQLPHLHAVRLVAVTGYGQQSDRERSRAAGFDLHLVKPLAVADVIRAVEGDPETP